MMENLKIVFLAAYFILAPLAGYYWGRDAWIVMMQRERGRIITEQMKMAAKYGGTVFIPAGNYMIVEEGGK